MKADRLRNKRTVTIIALILLWLFAMWKIRLGMHSDEVHSIAVGDMIASGNSFFKECWFYLQMSAVFTAPVISVYEKITGGKEGILLLFRILSVCIQSGICVYFYHVFREKYEKKYVLISSILLFTFIPDFQSFTYKQELLWFATMEMIFSYRYYMTLKKRYLVFLGVMIACSVLAYPTAILQFPMYLFLVGYINKIRLQHKDIGKDTFMIVLTCFLCAVIFFIAVFSRLSVSEFIEFFPKVFLDNNLDKSFLSKLVHPAAKFGIMGIMTIIPIMVCNKIKEASIPVCTCLLCLAFLGQMYIERSGVTWHCITYSYALTVFIVPLAYLLGANKEKNRILFLLFEIPAIGVIFCIALASNQGNITSMYGTVFSAVALLLMLGDKDNEDGIIYRERHLLAASLCICALSMYIIPVAEQEAVMPDHKARTIFTERFLASDGSAKGIYLGDVTYEQYYRICGVVEDHVLWGDEVFIIDDAYTASYGYLASKGKYATYSPQGGWGLAESDQAVKYFTDNYEKQPTVVIIRLDYIGSGLAMYLEETPVGNYLKDNGYHLIEERDGYAVMRYDVAKSP